MFTRFDVLFDATVIVSAFSTLRFSTCLSMECVATAARLPRPTFCKKKGVSGAGQHVAGGDCTPVVRLVVRECVKSV